MKKHLLLIITMLIGIASAFAQGGTTGPLIWELNGNTLIISGEGDMPDYEYWYDQSPWYEYRESIHIVVIEIGVTSIGNFAFVLCNKLNSITLPNSISSIGHSAFSNCSRLTSITLPNSISSIGNHAFTWCSALTSIILPNGISSIENGTFQNCASLTSIVLPKNLTTIGAYAFLNTNLTSITNLNPVPATIEFEAFGGIIQSECTLKVPINSVSAYQTAEVWKEFNIAGIEVGIESIEGTTVKIYPNPTIGRLKIESGKLRVRSVAIYDVFGKIQKIEIWKMENAIDISHLLAGVYFVKISTEAGEVTKKVLKE